MIVVKIAKPRMLLGADVILKLLAFKYLIAAPIDLPPF